MSDVEPRRPLSKISTRRSTEILNHLTESTFFYREDAPDLFDYLRRHQADYREFFEQFFGWGLHVDRKCARLFKRELYNTALRPKQRDLFALTRRDECLVFLLLLEFHELQMQAQNVLYEQDENLCFVLADFVRHAIGRYREELADACPPEREILDSVRSLFAELERHRFLRERERDPDGSEEQVLYEAMPGLHCYDPTVLASPIFARAYGRAVTGETEAVDSAVEGGVTLPGGGPATTDGVPADPVPGGGPAATETSA